MFSLAIQPGKLAQAPYVPSPRVSNTQSGFFEVEQFRSVIKHLPVDLQPIVEFAYLTGWRIGEIIGLEWAQRGLPGGLSTARSGSGVSG